MKIDPKIFKAYDIRGVYPDEINGKIASQVAKGIYRFFKEEIPNEKLRIGLGRDMRVSSPEIYEAVKKEFLNYGVELYDFDLVSTPAIYWSALKFNLDGVVQITASHNPKEYNGIKFLIRKVDRLVKASGNFGIPKVKDYVLRNDFLPYSEYEGMLIKKENFDEEYVEDTLNYFGNFEIPKIKVVIDTANALGILYLKPLIKKLDLEVIFLNEELDGNFPAHEADPLKPKNLVQLQKAVVKNNADLGIEPDGDGDRIFFVDEKGQIISPTRITSIIARQIFREGKGKKVIVDVRYVKNVKKIAEKYGGEVGITRVGHAFITEDVNKEKAIFAGESSGHYYFYDYGGAENSVLPVLFVLKELSKTGKKISELVQEVSLVEESGEINFKLPVDKSAQEVFNLLKEKYSEGEILTIDGITVDFGNWRFNFRASNTEPLIRLNLEAEDKALLNKKLNELLDFLKSLGIEPIA